MPLNPACVGAATPPVARAWSSDDALLYAVAVGAGPDELAYVTENSIGVHQAVLPTMAVTLGAVVRDVWDLVGPFDRAGLVHGEQAVELAGPIPVTGRALAVSRVAGVYDKERASVRSVSMTTTAARSLS